MLFWCLRHPELLHSLYVVAYCLPGLLLCFSLPLSWGLLCFAPVFIRFAVSPSSISVRQGWNWPGDLLLPQGTQAVEYTCGDFLWETKLKILMIHKNTTENRGFLVAGTGYIQFCVLLSCLHISSSCTDDFFCKLQFNTALSFKADVCCGKLGDFVLTARYLLGSCCGRELILGLPDFFFYFKKGPLSISVCLWGETLSSTCELDPCFSERLQSPCCAAGRWVTGQGGTLVPAPRCRLPGWQPRLCSAVLAAVLLVLKQHHVQDC